MSELEKQQAKTIALQQEQIEQQQKQIESLQQQITQLKTHAKLQQERIDHLIRLLHKSSSEKIDPAQLELLLDPEAAKKPDAAEAEEDALAAENIISIEKEKTKRAYGRRGLPEHLPTTEEIIIPEEVQAAPEEWREIDKEVTEKLNVEPTRYIRHLIIRPIYVKVDGTNTFLTAKLPPSVHGKSPLTPSLLAHILTAKFNDHLPFDRQSNIARERYGVKLSPNKLCNWAAVGAETLQPLYHLLASDIRQSNKLHVDETPVTYLDRKEGGSKQGYFWVYRSNTAILYDWHTGRSHYCLDNILIKGKKQFKGQLQCDGYSAYNTWAEKHDIVLLGCWAHARRKFKEALPYSQDAAKILHIIQQIYSSEKPFKTWLQQHGYPPEAIVYLRRRKHKKLLSQLRTTLKKLEKVHLPKSKIGQAITYMLNQWYKLCVAFKCSERLDNNLAENAVRPLKLGAKNWLFIGREDTGWRSAVIYTMIENCRILGRDPYAYLKWVFEKLPSMTNQDNLRLLLPAHWAELHPMQRAVRRAS